MHGEAGDGILLHVQVPELDCHVVPRQQVAPVSAKANVRNTADDLREKGAGPGLHQVTAPSHRELAVPNAVTSLVSPSLFEEVNHVEEPTWGSTSSKDLELWSHSADVRMSASRMQPLLLLKANTLQLSGWKSADVITCTIGVHNFAATMATPLLPWLSRNSTTVPSTQCSLQDQLVGNPGLSDEFYLIVSTHSC